MERLADIAAKTVGAFVFPGAGGTLAGELSAWAVQKGIGVPDPVRQLQDDIAQTIDDVTKKLVNKVERGFPSYDVEAAAAKVAETMSAFQPDPAFLMENGWSGGRLAAYFLEATVEDAERTLGAAAGVYRRLLQEICHRIVAIIVGSTPAHGLILKALLEERAKEIAARRDGTLRAEQIRIGDDEFAFDYRYEADFLMPTFDVVGPGGGYLELPLERVFHPPRAKLDGTAGPALDLLDGGGGWIVRGDAGAGKSVFLRGLLLMALRGELPARLAGWRDKVPLYLDASGDALPTPTQALARYDGRLVDRAPQGWVERLIKSGSAILLLDNLGLDARGNRSPQRARKARRLVEDALDAGCVVLLDARSAVPARWAGLRGLREITLLGMTPVEIDRFVVRWHRAAAESCTTAHEVAVIHDACHRLLLGLGQCADVRDLCGNPMFLSLLCREALTGGLALPDDSVALVRRVFRMMGEDPLRPPEEPSAVTDDDWDRLTELAQWSVQNGDLFTLDDAAAAIDATPSRVAEMVDGCRILRVDSQGKISFAMDAARQALAVEFFAQRRFLGYLCDRARHRAGRRTVVAAMAHLRQAPADDLLERLVAAAAEATAAGDLAAADGFLGTALAAVHVAEQVDPGRRHAVLAAAADLFPPRSPEQVSRVAAVGDVMLDPLTRTRCADAADQAGVAECVAAIAEAYGPAALPAVATIAADADASTREMIVKKWEDRPDGADLAAMIAHRVALTLIPTDGEGSDAHAGI